VADAAGTAVIVDVCLNYSPLGSNDYFVINNAKQGAEALMPTITQYLDASNVRTPTKLIPFVCGALHDAANEPKRVAEAIDGDVTQRRQPLWVAPEISSDMEYLQALQTVSTYLFQRGLEKASVTEPPNSVPPESPAPDDVRKAADVIVRKSGRSSLVYVGVMGHSLSSAKAATLGVVRVAAGVASIAVGPTFTVGGATYGVMVIPGGPIDKRQMVATLFDLQQASSLSGFGIVGYKLTAAAHFSPSF